jgi:hypothetical protein
MITATPDPFFEFDSWTGDFSSTVNPLPLVVNSNVSLTAHFHKTSFTDDFETGNLLKINWATSGNLPWFVQTNTVLAGNYAARSGAIANRQSSSLLITTNFDSGAVSFFFKVSSEPGFDLFNFYIDGVQQQSWSGEVDWTSFSTSIAAGTHTLEWRYTKDPNGTGGLDAAFIDNVNLPLRVPVDASTPAHLNMARQSDGTLLLTLTGQTNQQYVIQGATNLALPITWQNLSTNTANGGVIQFVDPATGSNPIRFYRAVAP